MSQAEMLPVELDARIHSMFQHTKIKTHATVPTWATTILSRIYGDAGLAYTSERSKVAMAALRRYMAA